jgi:hypothetical protein
VLLAVELFHGGLQTPELALLLVFLLILVIVTTTFTIVAKPDHEPLSDRVDFSQYVREAEEMVAMQLDCDLIEAAGGLKIRAAA